VHPHDAQYHKILELIRKIKAEILNAEGSALLFFYIPALSLNAARCYSSMSSSGIASSIIPPPSTSPSSE
jgi:hypothetical protein